MKITISVLFLFVVMALAGFTANAQRKCVVDDPTNTPLNVRATPNGRVVAKLRNGTMVHMVDYGADDQERDWIKIGTYRKGKFVVLGYVLAAFLRCY